MSISANATQHTNTNYIPELYLQYVYHDGIQIYFVYQNAEYTLQSKICFNVFGSVFCSARLHLFDQNTVKTVKYYNIIIKNSCEYVLNCNLFLWSKLYFQHHYSSLQRHMIFRNHNNILIYYQCWKQLCCTIFLWKLMHFIFQDSQMNRKLKKQHLFKIIFCNKCLYCYF